MFAISSRPLLAGEARRLRTIGNVFALLGVHFAVLGTIPLVVFTVTWDSVNEGLLIGESLFTFCSATLPEVC